MMSGVKRSSSAHNLHNFSIPSTFEEQQLVKSGDRDLNDNFGAKSEVVCYDDLAALNFGKLASEEGQDGLHKSKANPSLIPIQNALNDLIIERAPDHLLIDKTPEGFRRIRAQKRRDSRPEEDGLSWIKKASQGAPPGVAGSQRPGERGSYIPYPGGAAMSSSEDPRGTTPVELQVTNLDQSVDQKEMKKLITALFREHVNVLHVSVFFQSDGNMAACVRVPSITDAQFAISQLHRKKVGFKRILISHSHCNSQNPAVLRSKVTSILKEVPGGRIQLFKFREMFEKRFHDSIGVSDLYKMKDLVTVTEDSEGRMVTLNKASFNEASQYPPTSSGIVNLTYAAATSKGVNDGVVLDPAFCPVHCSSTEDTVGWAERENGTLLPNVNLSLAVLGPNMKQLVKSHGGSLPLASLSICYTAEFGKDSLPADNENGVAFEHLVSCIRGIQVVQASSGAKRLMLIPTLSSANLPQHWNYPSHQGMVNKEEIGEAAANLLGGVSGGLYRNSPFSTPGGNTNLSSSLASSNSSSASSSLTNLNQIPYGNGGQFPGGSAAPLAGQLSLFTRELVDLLKATPGCKMPFHKFIPSYHHHFGRQCRVADYGYTKLKDLFEALPHVIQIMGEGRSRAMITLSHRAQVKRFTSDLLRVLKSQASKQVSLSDLPSVFEKTLNRKFKISDYGVCDVEDILQEVSETSVVLSGEGDDVYIAIPKREQTQDEMERTHHFAKECIELLRHAPDCRLPFDKFVPAYHHHFGRQCRVADYGFTKLIELFEAIPLIVEITEDADGERLLQLTDGERLKVLGTQIESLIQTARKQKLPLDQLEELYRRQFGYPLRPDDYGESNVVSILKKLPQLLRVETGDENEITVRLIDRTYIRTLGVQVKEILSEISDGRMKLDEFEKKFIAKFKAPIKSDQIFTDLSGLIEVEKPDGDEKENNNQSIFIKLTSLQLCAVKIQKLLEDHQEKILCSEFEAAFVEKYNTPLLPGQYGYPSLNSLIRALPENFAVRGRGARKMIWYLKDGNVTPAAASPMMASSAFGTRPFGGQQRPPLSLNRFSGNTGGTTRFSTSRHEGFRMAGPPSRRNYGYSSSPWNRPQIMADLAPTSPMHSKYKSQPISFPGAPSSPASRRFNYPPPPSQYPTSQQEMDLAQFGLFPSGQNGHMIPSSKPQRQRHQFAPFPSVSSSNPFLTTPGNSFGLGSQGGKFMSTSPLSSCSPIVGGPSLLPVPHSPLMQNSIGAFNFPSNPWMSYYDESRQCGPATTPPTNL